MKNVKAYLIARPSLLLLLVLIGSVTYGQSKTVRGKVTDATDGSELPGVTIQIKGTISGTNTDLSGNYELTVGEDDILVFSYTGYVSVEQAVNARTVIDVGLQIDIEELSEVVVIGYGQVEAKDVTGVVSKVDEKTFNKGMLTTPDQLLAGKVAGVNIVSNDGTPGGQSSIRIRGGTSLTASNEPLYVIDGIPIDNTAHNPGGFNSGRNPLNFINPTDIADITVLKDASAAAIYGSRGANGVIIITTKQGKSGKLEMTYDGSIGFSIYDNPIRMLTTEEYRFIVGQQSPRNARVLGEADTDWVSEILQTPVNQNHNISISGGGKTNNFRASINYQDINGVIKTSNTNRIAGNLNFNQKLLNDDLQIGLVVKVSGSSDRFGQNTLGTALRFDPTQPVFDSDDDTFGGYFQWDRPLSPSNPVSSIDNTFEIGRTTRYFISTNVAYNLPFIEGLQLKLNYSYDGTDADRQKTSLAINSGTAQGITDNNGGFNFEHFNRSSQVFEGFLDYTKALDALDATVSVTAGYSYQDFFRDFAPYAKEPGVSLAGIGINDPLAYAEQSQLDQLPDSLNITPLIEFENRLLSYWGRVNFDLKDKYLLTLTYRRDGSTKFAKSNRWGIFPSVAAGWRISDEPFLANSSTVSNLKLRLSYGITGNQEIDDYLYVNLYDIGGPRAQYLLGGDPTVTFRPGAVDPNIKWEETSSFNMGFDFGFLEGRINGAVDVYRKFTKDLLADVAFPIGTLPGDRAVTNIGEIENQGVELLLNGVIMEEEDLGINVSFNGAFNRNEIQKLDNQSAEDAANFFGYQVGDINGNVGQTISIWRVGEALNSFLVYQHIMKPDGRPVSDQEDFNNDGLVNDLDLFVDQNGDGVINNDDLIILNNPAPDFILGFTGNVRYKKFDAAFTFRANLGNYVYNNVFSEFGTFQDIDATVPSNIHISAFENDFANRSDELLHSSIYIENASFLKLDNLTIGYNTSIGKVRSRFYATGTNLLTITGYSGAEPEAGIEGIDKNLYPRSSTLLFGVNLQLN